MLTTFKTTAVQNTLYIMIIIPIVIFIT